MPSIPKSSANRNTIFGRGSFSAPSSSGAQKAPAKAVTKPSEVSLCMHDSRRRSRQESYFNSQFRGSLHSLERLNPHAGNPAFRVRQLLKGSATQVNNAATTNQIKSWTSVRDRYLNAVLIFDF